LQAFLVSTGVVALAEIGDKTQLLSLVLAARFRRPWPVILGILVATLLNHAGAGAIGAVVSEWLGPRTLRWVLALSFFAMAAWTLVPDKLDEDEAPRARGGVFLTTLVAFFLVEMGDKTQLATVALGARFDNLVAVTAGTTLGMMIANVPAVLLGNALVQRISMKAVRIVAAASFVAVGTWMLAEALG